MKAKPKTFTGRAEAPTLDVQKSRSRCDVRHRLERWGEWLGNIGGVSRQGLSWEGLSWEELSCHDKWGAAPSLPPARSRSRHQPRRARLRPKRAIPLREPHRRLISTSANSHRDLSAKPAMKRLVPPAGSSPHQKLRQPYASGSLRSQQSQPSARSLSPLCSLAPLLSARQVPRVARADHTGGGHSGRQIFCRPVPEGGAGRPVASLACADEAHQV